LDIDGIADVAEKNTISIAVFHHPYNWFESEFAKDFKSYISSHFDLVMTGHEHDPDNETVVSVKGTIQE